MFLQPKSSIVKPTSYAIHSLLVKIVFIAERLTIESGTEFKVYSDSGTMLII